MSYNAEISKCGKYRYVLRRDLTNNDEYGKQPKVKRCVFIMLNPSTADATQNDPTIEKCIKFAKRLNCTELSVVNLFAYRATDPKDLYTPDDPVGELNDQFIKNEIDCYEDTIIVAAWSVKPIAWGRAQQIMDMLEGRKVLCLRKSKSGHPWHPLYIPDKEPFKEFL